MKKGKSRTQDSQLERKCPSTTEEKTSITGEKTSPSITGRAVRRSWEWHRCQQTCGRPDWKVSPGLVCISYVPEEKSNSTLETLCLIICSFDCKGQCHPLCLMLSFVQAAVFLIQLMLGLLLFGQMPLQVFVSCCVVPYKVFFNLPQAGRNSVHTSVRARISTVNCYGELPHL